MFAALLASWPGLAHRRAAVHARPRDAREARQNAELVARCVAELGLPFELAAADVLSPGGGGLLPLALYLFQALPQLAPRGTVEFVCKLNEPLVRRRPLAPRCPAQAAEAERAAWAHGMLAAGERARPRCTRTRATTPACRRCARSR